MTVHVQFLRFLLDIDDVIRWSQQGGNLLEILVNLFVDMIVLFQQIRHNLMVCFAFRCVSFKIACYLFQVIVFVVHFVLFGSLLVI